MGPLNSLLISCLIFTINGYLFHGSLGPECCLCFLCLFPQCVIVTYFRMMAPRKTIRINILFLSSSLVFFPLGPDWKTSVIG